VNGRAYYNEHDPYCAAWLRNLIADGHIADGHIADGHIADGHIADGHIADGDVDERSIEDVSPDDVRGYTQCHFFAGIGVWSYALRAAGWDDSRPVWTGSCPCQPFSAAGKGVGFADERHLWPAWFHLISQCRPRVVFGEQVASRDGLGWLDLVQADLEGASYASAAVDLCAAGVGAPHIRQRLFFVAHADGERLRQASADAAERRPPSRCEPTRKLSRRLEGPSSASDALADLHENGCSARAGAKFHYQEYHAQPCGELGDSDGIGERTKAEGLQARKPQSSGASVLGDAGRAGLAQRVGDGRIQCGALDPYARKTVISAGDSFWSDAEWIYCRDGKYRPVEPGTFPLAHGATARVGRLRAYGNAINAEAAAEFICAYLGRDGIAT